MILNFFIKFFLNALSAPPVMTTINNDYSLSDFQSDIKRIPENKTSSASGRSYSFYKAISNFLHTSSIIVKLINICKNNKLLLSRWLIILQIMTCKCLGNFNSNSLGVIQLLKVDLNLYLCLIWGRCLVRNILNHNQFPPEQFGNRPGCWGSSAPLLEVLSFDHIRPLQTDASIFNNDATQCYNRVLANPSHIICQCLGLPHCTAAFTLEFFRTSRYHVKTVHGISEDFNSDALHPLFGVLQGSGAGPAMWLTISVTLISACNQFRCGWEVRYVTIQDFVSDSWVGREQWESVGKR